MKNIQVTEFCRIFMNMQVSEGDTCIDATVGNGHDTEYLAELVGDRGKVIGFDIQRQAIEATEKRLGSLIDRVELHLESHEQMDMYAEEKSADLIVFNFGYLPGGDHGIATKKESSLAAVRKSLGILKRGGVLILCIYSGGDSGFDERDAVLRLLAGLDPKKYLVMKTDYYNRKNNPPIPVIVVKL